MRDTFEHQSRRSNTITTNTNNRNKSPSMNPMLEDLFSYLHTLIPANRTPPSASFSTPNPTEEPEQTQKQEQTYTATPIIQQSPAKRNSRTTLLMMMTPTTTLKKKTPTPRTPPATPTSKTQLGPPCKPSKPSQNTKQPTATSNSRT